MSDNLLRTPWRKISPVESSRADEWEIEDCDHGLICLITGEARANAILSAVNGAQPRPLAIGDKVAKNPAGWIASEFDRWGAGFGVGEIVEVIDDGSVDVVWPNGRSCHKPCELLRIDGCPIAVNAESDAQRRLAEIAAFVTAPQCGTFVEFFTKLCEMIGYGLCIARLRCWNYPPRSAPEARRADQPERGRESMKRSYPDDKP